MLPIPSSTRGCACAKETSCFATKDKFISFKARLTWGKTTRARPSHPARCDGYRCQSLSGTSASCPLIFNGRPSSSSVACGRRFQAGPHIAPTRSPPFSSTSKNPPPPDATSRATLLPATRQAPRSQEAPHVVPTTHRFVPRQWRQIPRSRHPRGPRPLRRRRHHPWTHRQSRPPRQRARGRLPRPPRHVPAPLPAPRFLRIRPHRTTRRRPLAPRPRLVLRDLPPRSRNRPPQTRLPGVQILRRGHPQRPRLPLPL